MRQSIVRETVSLICLLVAVFFTAVAKADENSTTNAPQNVQSIKDALLFYPSKYPQGNWHPSNLKFEEVWFVADDGVRLHGWYCPLKDSRATILLVHGNGGNISTRAAWLQYLQTRLRVTTFIFDYRGYGRSEGTPTIEGALKDARAARAKLRELSGQDDTKIVLMGESLGGAIAVQLAAESSPRALILQSTFSSLRDVADVHYPLMAGLIQPSDLNSVSAIGKVACPLLQSHSTADSVIPIAFGEKLFKAANQPKSFVKVQRAGHDNWLTAEYLHRLDLFITEIQPGKGVKSEAAVIRSPPILSDKSHGSGEKGSER